ncbi:MAG: methyltransferase domain-containing protein [Traorella sp.]
MYYDILKIICCPDCNSNFKLDIIEEIDNEIIEGILTCEKGHQYFIHQGVLDFCSKEQEDKNNWSELYQEMDYESLDKEIENSKSEKEKFQQKMVIDAYIDEISKLNKGTIVDIATGRGMLLTQLAASIKDSVHVIATDLSFAVLMYDRLKLKKINPRLQVDYIACDATCLPLKDNCIDAAISFFGIANMLGIVDKGIGEASRILKPNGKLLDSFLLIKEDSIGFKKLEAICIENKLDKAHLSYLENDSLKMHETYFERVICDVICEDIKDNEENKLDLLPYPNEWYANVIYKCIK